MEKMDKLCQMIEAELDRKIENGLATSNLEYVYKLVDIYKDLKNIEYWDLKGEYYGTVLDEMSAGGYSYAADDYDDGMMYSERRGQRRDRRGRYSNAGGSSYRRGASYADGSRMNGTGTTYDRYMDLKQSYRSGGTGDCKQRMMATLDEYMDEFTGQLEEMMHNADCAEERDTIKRYISKFKGMI